MTTPEYSIYEASKSQYKQNVSRDSLPCSKIFDEDDARVVPRSPIHPSLDFAFVLDNVLSSKECENLVNALNANVEWTKWTEDKARLKFRDCETIEMNHPEFARRLFERIKRGMTETEMDCVVSRESDPMRWQRDLEGNWLADGTVNDVLFSRYEEGGHFAVHTDGFNVETFDKRSLFSIVLYLNDVPEGDGGETVFFSNDAKDKMKRDDMGRIIGDPAYIVAKVRPVAGRATVFFHNILHQSEPIRYESKTKKFIIRSDVMFTRNPPLLVEEVDKNAFKMYQQAEWVCDQDQEESARLFRMAFKRSAILSKVYGM